MRLPPDLSGVSAMHIPCHPVQHGFEGSAWARSLEVPLSDLKLLCGSIDGWMEEWRVAAFTQILSVKKT